MARKRYLEGADKVSRVFKALPRHSIDEITDALNRGAREIEKRAELLVPVDTGDLKKDIKVESRQIGIRGDGKAAVVRVVAGTRPETAIAAFRTEFGRAKGGVIPGTGGKIHPGSPPRSWFFTAYQSVRKRVRSRVKRSIRKAARRAVGLAR